MFIRQHNILYLHPGKTGGTSVERMLKVAYDLEDFRVGHASKEVHKKYLVGGSRMSQHANIEHALNLLKKYHPDYDPSNLYTFATVRNPFDKVVSAYYYLRSRYRKTEQMSFEDFILRENVNVKWMGLKYLSEVKISSHFPPHCLPQHTYTHQEGKQYVDRVVKLERFDQDVQAVGADLGVELKPLKVNSRKRKKTPEPHWTDEMRARVYAVYQADFEYFNYSAQPAEPGQVVSA